MSVLILIWTLNRTLTWTLTLSWTLTWTLTLTGTLTGTWTYAFQSLIKLPTKMKKLPEGLSEYNSEVEIDTFQVSMRIPWLLK